MRALLVVVLIGCGSVKSNTGSDAPVDDDAAQDGPVLAPGTFLWQQNMFTSFPTVAIANDEPYVSASMFGALDVGGGILVPAGGQDVLIAHFNKDGVHQSSWRHGGTADEFNQGLAVDPFGNPAVAGLYRTTGGTIANAGGLDLPAATSFLGYAARYQPDGTLVWQLPLNTTGELFPRNSSVNGSGNTGVGGHFTGTLDFGGGVTRTSNGGKDAFYVRINDTGGVATLVTLGGTGDDTGNGAFFDTLGTVVIIGTFTGTMTVGSTTLDAGAGRDLFVTRMTLQGAPMWAIQGGGAMDVGDLPVAAILDSGDIIVACEFGGTFTLTGGDTMTSLGANDIAVARISSAGVPTWTKSYGGAGQDRPRAIAVGSDDSIALTGEFNGSATFGGDTFANAGFIDGFVAKYVGANGAHVWSRPFGSAADDRGLGVAVDSTGAVYMTASFHNTVNFGGADLSSPDAAFNGVLAKYSP